MLDLFTDAMRLAFVEASSSPDPSTQNGVILVRHIESSKGTFDLPYAVGINEFPTGVTYNDERWERPTKYDFIEHAERNAIYSAARLGMPTGGTTMVAVWASCTDCARAIIQAGIVRLVRYVAPDPHGHWGDNISTADTILVEGGIEVVNYDLPMQDVPVLLRNGEKWDMNGAVSE